MARLTEADLAADMARYYDDPLGWVMYAYPWDTDPGLQLVRLSEPWASRYPCKHGPDAWACEYLDTVGAEVRRRGFDGRAPVPALQMAVASGHGIGKSTLTAWLVGWIMSTRPHARGVVTANTSEQLATKTWAEISRWARLSITAHWWDITTGRGAMSMRHRQQPDAWRCDAQTCREENSEAFAGLHAATSTPFYAFDEASAVPDKIWEVAEGGTTDGEPMWFVFGNPTRNTGRFAECFGARRHRWITRQIDSRTVAITNKDRLAQWVADEGEDSDFVRVRVRGVFPSASSMQFIARELVDGAMGRRPAVGTIAGAQVLVGVDVARYGDDASVIYTRVGRDGVSHPRVTLRGVDTQQLAARVGEHVNELRRVGADVVLFVDGGGVGGGVVDRLRALGYRPLEVNFGSRASQPRAYANLRAEMWARMREWLAIGSMPADEALASELTAPEYTYTVDNRLQLERKEDMKRRGQASPDAADALALTFAHPVQVPNIVGPRPATMPHARRDYDPLSRVM
ncbi:MAG TPA: terminase [Gammaproteobacteria bacterium]|nr:terminase [Gammaproteobacteria bacterium]